MKLSRALLAFSLVTALSGCGATEPPAATETAGTRLAATSHGSLQARVPAAAGDVIMAGITASSSMTTATATTTPIATTAGTATAAPPARPSPAQTAPTPTAPLPATRPDPVPAPEGRTINVAVGSPIGVALDQAGPADTVLLAPGVHPGPVVTRRAGTATAPIRITGPAGATIAGTGDGRLVEIRHSHVVLEGLAITNADILVWVENATGVRILGNTLSGAGSECLRVKYRSSANEIAHNVIEGCGLTDFDLARGEKNGEGVYIGTAPEQLGKNPTPEPDRSDHNWIHHNRISARAECVDVKEAATGTRVEANVCTGSLDPDGAGYSSRGSGTVFVGNTAAGLVGAGIRLGGDTDQDGTGSEVRANVLTGNGGYGLKVQRLPQGSLCGNDVRDNGRGPTNGEADPAQPC